MRPFKITPEKHKELMEKFSNYLKSVSMTSDSFSFTEHFTDVKNKNKVFITFSMKAYVKMRDLVDRYESEIGWYGFVDKISDLEYHVTDICVYPQLVTGATVKETNEPWDDDMPIEQIKRRHFHGHSHVNMAVSPSGVDMKHRADQVEMVHKDSFYIFMITNKKCAWSAAVFDLANNTVYNSDDVLIDVDLGDGEMLSDFVDNTKKFVKTSTAAAVTAMMNERNAVPTVSTITNTNSSPWLPKPKPEQPKKTSAQKTAKKQAHNSDQLTLTERLAMLDEFNEELEDLIAAQGDYYDPILGHVSDTPAICNEAVLKMMR